MSGFKTSLSISVNSAPSQPGAGNAAPENSAFAQILAQRQTALQGGPSQTNIGPQNAPVAPTAATAPAAGTPAAATPSGSASAVTGSAAAGSTSTGDDQLAQNYMNQVAFFFQNLQKGPDVQIQEYDDDDPPESEPPPEPAQSSN